METLSYLSSPVVVSRGLLIALGVLMALMIVEIIIVRLTEAHVKRDLDSFNLLNEIIDRILFLPRIGTLSGKEEGRIGLWNSVKTLIWGILIFVNVLACMVLIVWSLM
jgi:hypothetical protein